MKNFFVMMLVLIIIAGCGGGGDGGISDPEPIREGTDSLNMEFLKNSPPDEIFDNSNFRIGLILENKGAADIKNGILLTVTEQDNINIKDNPAIKLDMPGRARTNPFGSQENIAIKAFAKELPSQTETQESLITAIACYDYQTVASFDVCIDTDIYEESTAKKACEVQDVSGSGQGGPIVVTDVKVTMSPHDNENLIEPEFLITVANRGDGVVFRDNIVDEMCSGEGINNDDMNTFDYFVTLSDVKLECLPENIKLKDGSDEIRCSLKTGVKKEAASFTTVLVITLDYGYSETISKTVLIKKMT